MLQKDSEMLIKLLGGLLIGLISWLGVAFYNKLTKIESTLNQITQVVQQIGTKVGVDVHIITAATLPKRPLEEIIRSVAILPEIIKIQK